MQARFHTDLVCARDPGAQSAIRDSFCPGHMYPFCIAAQRHVLPEVTVPLATTTDRGGSEHANCIAMHCNAAWQP